MIDIHNHLIPAVDDGCQTVHDSLSLLKEAEKENITDIIITPHYMHNGLYHCFKQEIVRQLDALKKAYDGSIRLHPGNELYIHPELPGLLEQDKVCTLADSDYILVEFPFEQYRERYDEILYELSLDQRVIIAHPERYTYVQKDPNFCLRWLKEGYLLQCNQSSLFNRKTKKTLEIMLKHHFVSFIASDAHHKERPLTLQDAYNRVSILLGKEEADQLFTYNSKKVIENKMITADYQPIRFHSLFFRNH